jgi:hypothetical protein
MHACINLKREFFRARAVASYLRDNLIFLETTETGARMQDPTDKPQQDYERPQENDKNGRVFFTQMRVKSF